VGESHCVTKWLFVVGIVSIHHKHGISACWLMTSPAKATAKAAASTPTSASAPSPAKSESKRKPSGSSDGKDNDISEENKGLMATAQRKSITLKVTLSSATFVSHFYGTTILSVMYHDDVG
jgi:hypothetical protein